ncbi:MAG TPA: RNA polymerase sigma factor [Sphingomonadaceae bacterium]|nr:RNA polymerase sigma factor [Sphingomonadaceae bacterium]
MSKPFAVKGGGACSKHVLNTRLFAGASTRGGDVEAGKVRHVVAGWNPRVSEKATLGQFTSMKDGCSSYGILQEEPSFYPVEKVSEGGLAPPNCRDDADSLYRTEASHLTRYVARRVGCREEAADLVHDAFSRFLKLCRGQPSAVERPAAYLHQVTRNLIRDRARSDVRRAAHLRIVENSESVPGPDPQHLLETRDMLRRLEAAMLKLKPKTREIFMAHRLDGMSYAEIAQRTGLSVKGVEKQMSKAITQIDRLLGRP